MAFNFDKERAQRPIRVSWRLSAKTLAELDRLALAEGASVEDLVQQMLDHVLTQNRSRKGTQTLSLSS